MEYYIISLKHTSKGDAALTFWRANGKGYTLDKDTTGIYTEEQIQQLVDAFNVAVPKDKVDPFWMRALDYNDEYISVPNQPTVHAHLGISSHLMRPKKYAVCKMVFINTPV